MNCQQELNFGQLFFMTLGFIPFMICLPCWTVAKFIHEPYVQSLDNEPDEPVPFEYQYPLDDADEEGEERDFKKCLVLSNTPKGLVYLRYSKEAEGFEYWADNSIDYKYLETVARKYVTLFSCKSIYIDRFSLLKDKIIKLKEKIEDNARGDDSGEDSGEDCGDVFASLKSYNKKGNVENPTEIRRSDIVCDAANKYLNRGKLKDAVFIEKKKIAETSALSFSSWKLWNTQKED